MLSGCSNTETPNTNAGNTKPGNANSTPGNSGSVLNTIKTPEANTSNSAPTIGPVVMAYYEALKKKDDAALRKVLSAQNLKTLEADMKAEKKNSLSAFISELEPAPDKPFEVRNEQIMGDVATAEIRGGSYAVWTPLKFVKEAGEWKMTGESPDLDKVKKTAANTTAVK